MRKTKSAILFFSIAVLFLVGNLALPVSALEFGGIAVQGEIALREDLLLTTSDTCSGHAYFTQATARTDGCFAVCAPHVDTEPPVTDMTFRKQYVDLYHADGSFWKEVSFETKVGYDVELTERTLNLYFATCVIVYDLETEEARGYAIPLYSPMESGLSEKLRAKTFTCGEWEYTCSEFFIQRTTLIRKNATEEQVLVKMPGTYKRQIPVFLASMSVAVLMLIVPPGTVVGFIKRRRSKGTTDN